MIKFSGDTTDNPPRPVLGIGLSHANCDRLLKGEPIMFSTDGMDGLPSIQVFIMAGTDERSMALQLWKEGILTEAQIHEDPSLADPHAVRPADKEAN